MSPTSGIKGMVRRGLGKNQRGCWSLSEFSANVGKRVAF
jgi:hypothetical protein